MIGKMELQHLPSRQYARAFEPSGYNLQLSRLQAGKVSFGGSSAQKLASNFVLHLGQGVYLQRPFWCPSPSASTQKAFDQRLSFQKYSVPGSSCVQEHKVHRKSLLMVRGQGEKLGDGIYIERAPDSGFGMPGARDRGMGTKNANVSKRKGGRLPEKKEAVQMYAVSEGMCSMFTQIACHAIQASKGVAIATLCETLSRNFPSLQKMWPKP
jgi:hypothetical protein